jgi:hypothetical protein
MNNKPSNKANKEDIAQKAALSREDIAQKVAFILLGSYVLAFFVLIVINICLPPASDHVETDRDKNWFEMMKTSSILLGTALTTVIGYYFGQRESAQARREAIAAESKAEEKTQEAEEATEKAYSVKEQFDKLTADMPSGMPEDFTAIKTKLRKRI